MVVYFIYKHGLNFQPFLYALTDKKKLKDSFMKERKKSMFVVKEKELTKDEFINVCKHHGNYILDKRGFETKSPFKKLSNTSVIWLTATDYEEIDVIKKEDTVLLELSRFMDNEAKAFNSDILKALNKLHYFEIYKFINEVQCHHSYFVSGVDTFIAEKYKIDMFSVFLYLYGDTLDMEGLINEY